jgi:phospholipid transport system substrate-binding protein
MKKLMNSIFSNGLLLSAILVLGNATVISKGFAAEEATKSPIEQMRSVMNEVIEVVEELPGENQQTERLEKLRTIITPNFDFEEMAKRSLGQPWLTATEQERDEYVNLFSDLLAHTYLKRIDNVRRDMVSLDSERLASRNALVRTTVRYKGDTFPIDYRMIERESGWQVYDVIIENIGLVSNYRNEFAGIVRREKVSGLIERLRKKIADEGIAS